jgi:DNA-binding NarL/FixJ family response regulator
MSAYDGLMSRFKRPRVLIADDYPPVVAAFERLLAPHCDIVGSVSDGPSLPEATSRLKPDVILLDLNLSNGNSLSACREITRTFPQTRVIVVTGGMTSGLRPHVLAAGASAFIEKNAAPGELLAVIAQA